MTLWLEGLVEGLHILFAVAWFGAVLTAQLVTHPALERLPPQGYRQALMRYGMAEKRIIRPAVLGVIVMGVARGVLWGPVRNFDALLSPYGLTWLAALTLTVVLYWWGRYIMSPNYRRIVALPAGAEQGLDGRTSGALLDEVRTLRRNGRLQLVGFLVILGCMILMRFGY